MSGMGALYARVFRIGDKSTGRHLAGDRFRLTGGKSTSSPNSSGSDASDADEFRELKLSSPASR